MAADPSGNLTATLRLPATKEGETAKPDVDATFDGKVMGAATGIVAKMRGDVIDATVDAHAAAARIGEALGELPLNDALTIHAEAHGKLPKIAAKANVALGQATVAATADVETATDASPGTKIDTKVEARKINLAAIGQGRTEVRSRPRRASERSHRGQGHREGQRRHAAGRRRRRTRSACRGARRDERRRRRCDGAHLQPSMPTRCAFRWHRMETIA